MSKADLSAQQAEADAARARFLTTLQTLQQRLSPKTIASDVKDKALEKANGAIEAAKDGMVQAATHPSTVAAITVPVLVYLFRKPIAQGLSAVFGHDKNHAAASEGPPAAKELKHDDAQQPAQGNPGRSRPSARRERRR
ncbi:MAG: DUF3618 domain-containing protein [Proteobacteria bacterium]|nr:DUF3618 domain-containing protein [Pseudomonadota bacterium]